jgi:probable addiction module antidote protein
MNLETFRWDPADNIKSAEDAAAYLEAAFEDGDPAVITTMLGAVARSRGMTGIAREAGVTREALYRALSKDGDPRLTTILGVLKALGLRLTAEPAAHPRDA